LPAGVLMLLCLGTNQAWSVYVEPLKTDHGLTDFQTQLVFATAVLSFCTVIILSGRLHDRLGPRPVALGGAGVIALAYLTASLGGGRYFFLWLGMGLLYGTGCATVYTCPIATAIKWFPRHRGLVAGLSAAAFGCGPAVAQSIALALLGRGWRVTDVIGFIGLLYTPLLAGTALLLWTPPDAARPHAEGDGPGAALLRDRRFWVLFVGMLGGTFPFLLVMANAKPIATDFGIGLATVLAVPAMAVGNAAGRIVWGYALDRVGTRRAVRAAQVIMLLSAAGLMACRGRPAFFLAAAAGIGFCYGSNFAIYPATVARIYGAHRIGSVYPLVMVAQGISSSGPALAGCLNDLAGSYVPGMAVGAGVAAAGLIVSVLLARRLKGRLD